MLFKLVQTNVPLFRPRRLKQFEKSNSKEGMQKFRIAWEGGLQCAGPTISHQLPGRAPDVDHHQHLKRLTWIQGLHPCEATRTKTTHAHVDYHQHLIIFSQPHDWYTHRIIKLWKLCEGGENAFWPTVAKGKNITAQNTVLVEVEQCFPHRKFL